MPSAKSPKALNQLERWMVDYEGEEGGPVETQLSWITGPDGDPTTRPPDIGDYLVRLRDVERLSASPKALLKRLAGEFEEGGDAESAADEPGVPSSCYYHAAQRLREEAEGLGLAEGAREMADNDEQRSEADMAAGAETLDDMGEAEGLGEGRSTDCPNCDGGFVASVEPECCGNTTSSGECRGDCAVPRQAEEQCPACYGTGEVALPPESQDTDLYLLLHRFRDEATWLRSHGYEERAKVVENWIAAESPEGEEAPPQVDLRTWLLSNEVLDQVRIAMGYRNRYDAIVRPTYEQARKGMEAALHMLAALPSESQAGER